MRAANEGAKQAKGGVTIGILPGGNARVSLKVDVAIITDTGEARNSIIGMTAEVVIRLGLIA